MKIKDLKAHKIRIHFYSDEVVDRMAENIKRFGVLNPIAINPKGVVLDGHIRVLACRKLGIKDIMVIEHPERTESDEIRVMLSMNRIGGSFDVEALKPVMDEIGDDALSLGFTEHDLESLDDTFRSFDVNITL